MIIQASEASKLVSENRLGSRHEFERESEDESGDSRNMLMPPMRDYPPEMISPFEEKNLTEAGYDLRVGEFVKESDTIQTDFKATVQSFEDVQSTKDGFVCQADSSGRRVYYILNFEEIVLPEEYGAVIDSKSTTGRAGGMCHDVRSREDKQLPIRRFSFPMVFQPYAFPILLRAGKTSLAQMIIRFQGSDFVKNCVKDLEGKVEIWRDSRKLDLAEVVGPDGLEMTFSTKRVYRAKQKVPEALDLTLKEHYKWEDYFDLIDGNGEVEMEPHRFYLFGTREEIRMGNVCGRLSREHHHTGTGLWSHFAGFFMPGYAGEITLECLSTTKRVIGEGEPAGLVIFDEVSGSNVSLYRGEYQGQKAPRLPKIFKS